MADDQTILFKLLDKPTEYSDEEIAELWRVSPQLRKSGMDYQALAHMRSSLATMSAVRRFDIASADLIKTTNKLTSRIYWLTWVVTLLGAVQTVFLILDYLTKK
jgi:hypothetical protein